MKKVLSILILLLTMVQGAWADLIISNAVEWNTFANSVSAGNTYAGQTVTLANDLSVSLMAGTVGHPFCGTLDGQGHVLGFSWSRENGDVEEPLAPFAELSGATIKNLRLNCDITTNGKRPASLAGFVTENSTIINCISYPDNIKSTMSGNICAGGFVGQVKEGKTLTMEGCVFMGKITYSNAGGYGGGGFVGYLQPGATVNFTNCFFAPESLSFAKTENNFHMFASGDGSSAINIDNCYHNDVAAATTGISVQGKRAYRIDTAYDVSMSISGDATATYNISSLTLYSAGFKLYDNFYAAGNDVVNLSLSHEDNPGYIFRQYTAEGGGSLTNPTTDSPTLTMANADQTINAEWFLIAINSTDDWNTFVNNVNEGNDYSGLTVSLNEDISGVTTMVGTSEHPFRGTFDGQLHTLTVNINATERNAAPFNHVDGATIQNLRTAGSVTSSNMDIAGIVANVSGNTTIRNCTSSIDLLSSRSVDEKDVDAGGIVSHVNDNQTVNVIGCSFTGTINYSSGGNEGGGIVGWLREGATANVTGCVFAPTAIYISNWKLPFKMFVCGATGSTTNIDNCYYNDVAAAQSEITRQGKQMRRITWASNMSMSFSEEGTKYNADYITCYSTGIHYHYWYYAGAGDELPLTVTHFTPPEGYVWRNYTVTGGGALTAQTETSATLLMSDADQEIGLEWRPLPKSDVTWDATDAEKSNWTISPANPVTAGAAVTATYGGKRHVKSVKYWRREVVGGKFTINDSGDKVFFAKGNLQATTSDKGSTWSWAFAEHQWDYIGAAVANTTINGNGTVSSDGTVDLFCWSTTGCYLGISNANSPVVGDFVDWGSHADVIAGIGPGWRTLIGGKNGEWTYLFNKRSASTVDGVENARYAKAKVNNVYGVILFPDSYTHPDGVAAPKGINNTDNTGWNGNSYNVADWTKMEEAGCVFLPAAGSRWSTDISDANKGCYWSSTAYNSDHAWFVYLYENSLYAEDNVTYFHYGHSVRLVFPAE